MSLNSQFVFVLDGILCFSVQFCDNALLVLKIRFELFFFTNKKVQGFFQCNRKILMPLLSVLFYLQNHESVFWDFKFQPRYLGKRSLCPWNQPHFLSKSDKSLLSPEQNKLKEIWDTVFLDERQLKTIVPNKRFPEYILCLFALRS